MKAKDKAKAKVRNALFMIATFAIAVGAILGFRADGDNNALAAGVIGGNGSVPTAHYLGGGATESVIEKGVLFYVSRMTTGLNFDTSITTKNQYKKLTKFWGGVDVGTDRSTLVIVDPKLDEHTNDAFPARKSKGYWEQSTSYSKAKAGSTKFTNTSEGKDFKRIIAPYYITGTETDGSHVYLDSIRALGKKGTQTLKNGWEGKCTNGKFEDCSKLWAYFTINTSSDSSLQYETWDRIKKFCYGNFSESDLNKNLKSKLSKNDKQELCYKYIDLLMTLYTLAKYNGAEDAAAQYKAAINNVIEGVNVNNKNNVKNTSYNSLGPSETIGIEVGCYYYVSGSQTFFTVNSIDAVNADMGIATNYALNLTQTLKKYNKNNNISNFYTNDMAKNYAASYKANKKTRRAFDLSGAFASNLMNVLLDKKPDKNNGSTKLRDMTNTALIEVQKIKGHVGNGFIIPILDETPESPVFGLKTNAVWTGFSREVALFKRYVNYEEKVKPENKINQNKKKTKSDIVHSIIYADGSDKSLGSIDVNNNWGMMTGMCDHPVKVTLYSQIQEKSLKAFRKYAESGKYKSKNRFSVTLRFRIHLRNAKSVNSNKKNTGADSKSVIINGNEIKATSIKDKGKILEVEYKLNTAKKREKAGLTTAQDVINFLSGSNNLEVTFPFLSREKLAYKVGDTLSIKIDSQVDITPKETGATSTSLKGMPPKTAEEGGTPWAEKDMPSSKVDASSELTICHMGVVEVRYYLTDRVMNSVSEIERQGFLTPKDSAAYQTVYMLKDNIPSTSWGVEIYGQDNTDWSSYYSNASSIDKIYKGSFSIQNHPSVIQDALINQLSNVISGRNLRVITSGIGYARYNANGQSYTGDSIIIGQSGEVGQNERVIVYVPVQPLNKNLFAVQYILRGVENGQPYEKIIPYNYNGNNYANGVKTLYSEELSTENSASTANEGEDEEDGGADEIPILDLTEGGVNDGLYSQIDLEDGNTFSFAAPNIKMGSTWEKAANIVKIRNLRYLEIEREVEGEKVVDAPNSLYYELQVGNLMAETDNNTNLDVYLPKLTADNVVYGADGSKYEYSDTQVYNSEAGRYISVKGSEAPTKSVVLMDCTNANGRIAIPRNNVIKVYFDEIPTPNINIHTIDVVEEYNSTQLGNNEKINSALESTADEVAKAFALKGGLENLGDLQKHYEDLSPDQVYRWLDTGNGTGKYVDGESSGGANWKYVDSGKYKYPMITSCKWNGKETLSNGEVYMAVTKEENKSSNKIVTCKAKSLKVDQDGKPICNGCLAEYVGVNDNEFEHTCEACVGSDGSDQSKTHLETLTCSMTDSSKTMLFYDDIGFMNNINTNSEHTLIPKVYYTTYANPDSRVELKKGESIDIRLAKQIDVIYVNVHGIRRNIDFKINLMYNLIKFKAEVDKDGNITKWDTDVSMDNKVHTSTVNVLKDKDEFGAGQHGPACSALLTGVIRPWVIMDWGVSEGHYICADFKAPGTLALTSEDPKHYYAQTITKNLSVESRRSSKFDENSNTTLAPNSEDFYRNIYAAIVRHPDMRLPVGGAATGSRLALGEITGNISEIKNYMGDYDKDWTLNLNVDEGGKNTESSKMMVYSVNRSVNQKLSKASEETSSNSEGVYTKYPFSEYYYVDANSTDSSPIIDLSMDFINIEAPGIVNEVSSITAYAVPVFDSHAGVYYTNSDYAKQMGTREYIMSDTEKVIKPETFDGSNEEEIGCLEGEGSGNHNYKFTGRYKIVRVSGTSGKEATMLEATEEQSYTFATKKNTSYDYMIFFEYEYVEDYYDSNINFRYWLYDRDDGSYEAITDMNYNKEHNKTDTLISESSDEKNKEFKYLVDPYTQIDSLPDRLLDGHTKFVRTDTGKINIEELTDDFMAGAEKLPKISGASEKTLIEENTTVSAYADSISRYVMDYETGEVKKESEGGTATVEDIIFEREPIYADCKVHFYCDFGNGKGYEEVYVEEPLRKIGSSVVPADVLKNYENLINMDNVIQAMNNKYASYYGSVGPEVKYDWDETKHGDCIVTEGHACVVEQDPGYKNCVKLYYGVNAPGMVLVKYYYDCGCKNGHSHAEYTARYKDYQIGEQVYVQDVLDRPTSVEKDGLMRSYTCEVTNEGHEINNIQFIQAPADASDDEEEQLRKQKSILVTEDNDANTISVYYNSSTTVIAKYYSFSSEPRCYSEIKEGKVLHNADTANETFEAMAAVPSTEALYFTSGGSEFILDIYTQYIPDERAERTYKSYFASTNCEFKSGDTLKGASRPYKVQEEKFAADKDDNSYWKKDIEKKLIPEGYQIATPDKERLTHDGTSISSHGGDKLTCTWKGIIESHAKEPSKNVDGYVSNEYGSESTACHENGHTNGNPGTFNLEAATTKWDTADYNADLKKAQKWAEEMEKFSDDAENGNVWRISDSDGKKRVYHCGNAVITVQMDYGDYGADHKQLGTRYAGKGVEYTSDSLLDGATLDGTERDALGVGWCWWDGEEATYEGYVAGCVPCNHMGSTKYKSCPTWIALKADEDAKKAALEAEQEAHSNEPPPPEGSSGCSGGHVRSAQRAYDNAVKKREAHEALANTHKCGDFVHKTAIVLPDDEAVANSCSTGTGTSGKIGIAQNYVGNNKGGSVSDGGDAIVLSAGCVEKDIKYTITVEFEEGYIDGKNIDGYEDEGEYTKVEGLTTLPAHGLCGPCCLHVLPSVEDNWTQEIEYSYMRINGVRVWKIDKGKVDGLADVQMSEVDDLTSVIHQGDPNIFYNIGDMNTDYYNKSKAQLDKYFANGFIPSSVANVTKASTAGRLRYTLQSDQLDNVVWYEKNDLGGECRSPKCDGGVGCGTDSMGKDKTKNPFYQKMNKGHENKWSDGILYTNTIDMSNTSADNCEYWYNSGDVYDTVGRPLKVNDYRVDLAEDKMKTKGNYTMTIDCKDAESFEFARFLYRRNLENTAVVASDTLILQTSSGDQSVMYSANKQTRKTEQNFDFIFGDYNKVAPFKGWNCLTDTYNKVAASSLGWKGKNSNYSIAEREIKDIKFFDAMDSLKTDEGTLVAKNPYNFANESNPWTKMDTINIGSYNGRGAIDRVHKFSKANSCSINTVFDKDGSHTDNIISDCLLGDIEMINNDKYARVVGKNFSGNNANKSAPVKMQRRMIRPSRLRIYNPLEMDPTTENNKYMFGESVTFYKPILDWTRPTFEEEDYEIEFVHESETTSLVGELGLEYNAPYMDGQISINPIVVYDPIGISAGLVGLGDDQDQRTEEGLASLAANLNEIAEDEKCPGVTALCEFRVLDCKYTKDNDLARFDFDGVADTDEDTGEVTIKDSVNDITLDVGNGSSISNKALQFSGEALELEYSALGVTYSTDLVLEIGMDLKINKSSSEQVIFSLGDLEVVVPSNANYPVIRATLTDLEDADGNAIADVVLNKQFNGTITGSHTVKFTLDANGINDCKVEIDGAELSSNKVEENDTDEYYKLGSGVIGESMYLGDKDAEQSTTITFDNLYVMKKAGLTYHTDKCYKTVTQHAVAKDYSGSPCMATMVKEFKYTGAVQSYTAPETGTYSLQVYGAQGGGDTRYKGSAGGLGGYSEGTVSLRKGQVIYVYVGGKGTAAGKLPEGTSVNGGGYNGGGSGGEGGFGGGGMTHISLVNTDKIVGQLKKTKKVVNDTYTGNATFTDRSGVLVKTFTATANGTVKFYSTSYTADPWGHIYVNGSQAATNDDGGENLNFSCTVSVNAGDEVKLYVGAYSGAGSSNWICEYKGNTTSSGICTCSHCANPNCPNYCSGCGVANNTPCNSTCTIAHPVNEYKIEEVDTVNFNTNACLIVAGGGGGADNAEGGAIGTADDGSGGSGGGTNGGNPRVGGTVKTGYNGTQNSGYKQGLGQSSVEETDTGGAGGGWYGGKVTENTNGGAGGGSGYYKRGTVSDYVTSNGIREGNGYAVITLLSHDHVDVEEGGTCTYTESTKNSHTHTSDCLDMEYLQSLVIEAENGKKSRLKEELGDTFVDAMTNQGCFNKTQAGYTKAINFIKENVGDIDKSSGVFDCSGAYTEHVCNDLCLTYKVLNCSEPHHSSSHYDTSNSICYSPCNDDANHKKVQEEIKLAGSGTMKLGTYLNLDREFHIKFYNLGTYYETNSLGIAYIQLKRGVGFGSSANSVYDTTKWTREKRVKFGFDVLFYRDETLDGKDNGHWEQYNADTWIPLGVTDERFVQDKNKSQKEFADNAITDYKFYALLENDEMATTMLEYESEAINNCGSTFGEKLPYKRDIQEELCEETTQNIDKEAVKVNFTDISESGDTDYDKFTDLIYTNRVRTNDYRNNHGVYTTTFADLVGRIGNLLVSDTDDLRFCNLFKANTSEDNWLVQGIIHEVMTDVQNTYLSWHRNYGGPAVDVRNEKVTEDTGMYNTWYTQSWTETKTVDGVEGSKNKGLPVSGDKNNIEQLKNDQMRLGYNVYGEITTMGNYYNALQITPYFYALDTQTGELSPVDVYMTENDECKAINLFDAVNDPSWDEYNADGTAADTNIQRKITDYQVKLNWQLEKARRNYGQAEKWITTMVAESYGTEIEGTERNVNTFTFSTDGDGVPIEYTGSDKGTAKVYNDCILYDTVSAEEIEGLTRTVRIVGEGDARVMYLEGTTGYRDFNGNVVTCTNPIIAAIGTDYVSKKKQWDTPDNIDTDRYNLGTMQLLQLDGNARTFVGSAYTQNTDFGTKKDGTKFKDYLDTSRNGLKSDGGSTLTNLDNKVFTVDMFWKQAQRWHFTMGLPTSAMFNKTYKVGDRYYHATSDDEIRRGATEIQKGNYVILMTAKIIAPGEVWNLRYDQGEDNGVITVDGNTYKFTTDMIPNLIAVYSPSSNEEDIDLKESH